MEEKHTMIIFRGEKVPKWVMEILLTLGDVYMMSEELVSLPDVPEYTKTVFIIKGKAVPEKMIKSFQIVMGSVTISEETILPSPPVHFNMSEFFNQTPPHYIHKRSGIFTPDLFIRALSNGFIYFDDSLQHFARVEIDKIHIYSAKTRKYACVELWQFLQYFQGSGKPSFGERVDEILKSKNIDFIVVPTEVEGREAISLLKWDQSYAHFMNIL